MKNKSRYIIENIRGLKDKVFELSIITPLLCDKELLIVRPYTQFPVETTGNKKNYIDLYYEDIKLGIEIYEPFHDYQKDVDELRKKEIEDNLACELIEVRIDDEFDIFETIQTLKLTVLERVNEKRKSSDYKDWEVSFHSLSQAQNDYPNAIFVNANNFTEGVHGPIKVNPDVRANADLFVVYSGDTVYKVYQITPESWTEYTDSQMGYLQYGVELPMHELIASGATDWNVTTNRALGNNIQKYSSYRKSMQNKAGVSNSNKYLKNPKFKKIIRKTTRRK